MNPRRYSQVDRALQILDKSPTVETLKHDQYLLFLFKKTERIVAALYVVTSSFSDSEPLKWSLRKSGTRLIGCIVSFKERAAVYSREFLSDTFAEITNLFSLLDLAYISDLLSPMNFSVLKKELEATVAIIDGRGRQGGSSASPPFLEESFFGISKEIFEESKGREPIPTKASPESGSQESGSVHSLSELDRLKRGQKDIYKGHTDVKDTVLYEKGATVSKRLQIEKPERVVTRPLTTAVKEERRQRILEVLRQRKSAMIKDFSAVVTGCSEKTVQRLVVQMVRGGLLTREGSRRWSRYSTRPEARGEGAGGNRLLT